MKKMSKEKAHKYAWIKHKISLTATFTQDESQDNNAAMVRQSKTDFYPSCDAERIPKSAITAKPRTVSAKCPSWVI